MCITTFSRISDLKLPGADDAIQPGQLDLQHIAVAGWIMFAFRVAKGLSLAAPLKGQKSRDILRE